MTHSNHISNACSGLENLQEDRRALAPCRYPSAYEEHDMVVLPTGLTVIRPETVRAAAKTTVWLHQSRGWDQSSAFCSKEIVLTRRSRTRPDNINCKRASPSNGASLRRPVQNCSKFSRNEHKCLVHIRKGLLLRSAHVCGSIHGNGFSKLNLVTALWYDHIDDFCSAFFHLRLPLYRQHLRYIPNEPLPYSGKAITRRPQLCYSVS